MTEVIVAIIGLAGVIISVLVTARTTQTKMTEELRTQNAVQNEKISQLSTDIATTKTELTEKIEAQNAIVNLKLEHIVSEQQVMKADIKEHNNYARLFQEATAVASEKQSVANNRIKDLEEAIRALKSA